MGTTSIAELRIDEPEVRLAVTDGSAALTAVIGLDAVHARARLRFGPGRTCEPVARLLDRVIVQAEQAGLSPLRLIVASGSVQAGADIVRVRRKAHGTADWISSPTARVQISLQPAGLHRTATAGLAEPPAAAAPPAPARDNDGTPDRSCDTAGVGDVREALLNVIDPDLGVSIIDLGFVRNVDVQGRTAVITMTLTSAACPLTGIMEDQIRTELAALADIGDFRIDWVWLPPWRPADITDSGRDQLRDIGFRL